MLFITSESVPNRICSVTPCNDLAVPESREPIHLINVLRGKLLPILSQENNSMI
jgi:hypothetical protein